VALSTITPNPDLYAKGMSSTHFEVTVLFIIEVFTVTVLFIIEVCTVTVLFIIEVFTVTVLFIIEVFTVTVLFIIEVFTVTEMKNSHKSVVPSEFCIDFISCFLTSKFSIALR
jgi:hypothetical protein